MHLIPTDIGLSELRDILLRAGLPIETWVAPLCKTPESLLTGIRDGTIELRFDETPQGKIQLEAFISSVIVHICRKGAWGSRKRLIEKWRVAGGERLPARERFGIGGKILPDESSREAAQRYLREKIGLDGLYQLAEIKQYQETGETDNSFPGLMVVRDITMLLCLVGRNALPPDVIHIDRGDRKTVYEWEKISRKEWGETYGPYPFDR